MSFFSSSAPEEAATDGEGGLTEDQIAAAAFDTEAAAAAADVTDSPEMRARCEARGMPPPATWPSRPVLVRAAPHAKMTLDPDLPLPCGCAVPINDSNQPVPFETALFKGKMLARIRGVHVRGPNPGAAVLLPPTLRPRRCLLVAAPLRLSPFPPPSSLQHRAPTRRTSPARPGSSSRSCRAHSKSA